MIYSNAKAIALLRDLGNKLQIRFANQGAGYLNTLTQGFYTDNDGAVWPYILLSNGGTVTAGNPVLWISINSVSAVSKDIFGNNLDAYTPSQMIFAYELGAAGNETEINHSDLIQAEFESIKCGVAFSLVELAHGTAVTAANIGVTAAPETPVPVVVTVDELYWPTKLN
jgi:hypothetical protein